MGARRTPTPSLISPIKRCRGGTQRRTRKAHKANGEVLVQRLSSAIKGDEDKARHDSGNEADPTLSLEDWVCGRGSAQDQSKDIEEEESELPRRRTPALQPPYVEHKVCADDTLAGICLRYHCTPTELRRLNCFSGDAFGVRSSLVVPNCCLTAPKSGGGQQVAGDNGALALAKVWSFVRETGVSEAKARSFLERGGWDYEQVKHSWKEHSCGCGDYRGYTAPGVGVLTGVGAGLTEGYAWRKPDLNLNKKDRLDDDGCSHNGRACRGGESGKRVQGRLERKRSMEGIELNHVDRFPAAVESLIPSLL